MKDSVNCCIKLFIFLDYRHLRRWSLLNISHLINFGDWGEVKEALRGASFKENFCFKNHDHLWSDHKQRLH